MLISTLLRRLTLIFALIFLFATYTDAQAPQTAQAAKEKEQAAAEMHARDLREAQTRAQNKPINNTAPVSNTSAPQSGGKIPAGHIDALSPSHDGGTKKVSPELNTK